MRQPTLDEMADTILSDASKDQPRGTLRHEYGILDARRLKVVNKREHSMTSIKARMSKNASND